MSATIDTRLPTPSRLAFAGRKLVGLVIGVIGMVGCAIATLSLCAAEMLDGGFAENITITVVGGIATLYATFVGGNYGEHVAKSRNPTAAAVTAPTIAAD
jgi:hypothetical protein